MRRRAGAARRVLEAVCERWDVRCTVIGVGHRHPPPARLRRRRAGRRHAGRGARRRLPALRPRARGARRADLPGADSGRWSRASDLRGDACSRCSRRRTSPRAGRCSSSTTRSSSRAPCAVPRLPTPPCSSSPTTTAAAAAIAVSIDGNGRRVACDPYCGRPSRRCSSARRNLACVGAEPLGLTNCLNFGNPEKPHIAWQLSRSVDGMRAACTRSASRSSAATSRSTTRASDGPIYPTPVVGMVGELPEPERAAAIGLGFREEGHVVALCGPFAPRARGLGAGEAARRAAADLAVRASTSPPSSRPQDAVREAVRAGDLASAHDIAEGGLPRRDRRVLHRRRHRRSAGRPGRRPRGRHAELEPYLFGEGRRRLHRLRAARGGRAAGREGADRHLRNRRRRRARDRAGRGDGARLAGRHAGRARGPRLRVRVTAGAAVTLSVRVGLAMVGPATLLTTWSG